MNKLPGFTASYSLENIKVSTNQLNILSPNYSKLNNRNIKQSKNVPLFSESRTIVIPTAFHTPQPMPDDSPQAQFVCLSCKSNCSERRQNTCDDFYQAKLEICDLGEPGQPKHEKAACLSIAHETYRACIIDLADICATECGNC